MRRTITTSNITVHALAPLLHRLCEQKQNKTENKILSADELFLLQLKLLGTNTNLVHIKSNACKKVATLCKVQTYDVRNGSGSLEMCKFKKSNIIYKDINKINAYIHSTHIFIT